MLKILSYLNIVFALSYFLLFLLNGSYIVIAGIVVVLILNVLVLKSIQQELSFKVVHYTLGLISLCFAVYLMIGLIHVFKSSLAYNYFDNTILYIVFTAIFVASIVMEFVFICLKDIRNNGRYGTE